MSFTAQDLWLHVKPCGAKLARIVQIADSCPSSGNGVHTWLFTGALRLHRLDLSIPDIESILYQATAGCGREMRTDEVEDAVRNSAEVANRPYLEARKKWKEPDFDLIAAIALAGRSLNEVQDQSVLQIDRSQNYAEELIDTLFPGDPLLCVGERPERCCTATREYWRDLFATQALMVPSAMTRKYGRSKKGTPAQRSIDNTGQRMFQVVEFDIKEFDKNRTPTAWAPLIRAARAQGKEVCDISAALHAHLADFRPLVMLVHSGSGSPEASIHGWYPCFGEPDEALFPWMRYAVSLGADRATWCKAQCIRVPDGRRHDGNKQQVLYFNPSALTQEAR